MSWLIVFVPGGADFPNRLDKNLSIDDLMSLEKVYMRPIMTATVTSMITILKIYSNAKSPFII